MLDIVPSYYPHTKFMVSPVALTEHKIAGFGARPCPRLNFLMETALDHITIHFCTSSRIESAIIRGAQMGFPYSHVECLTPAGTYLGSVEPEGVADRPLNYGTFAQEAFVDVPCSPEQADAFYSFMRAQIGKPYDHEAILQMAEGTLISHEVYDSPGVQPAWICSASIMAALLAVGVVKAYPANVRVATPRDVFVVATALAGSPYHR